MPARRPKKRTRDTHDPQTSLPSKLLDEISPGLENKRVPKAADEKHVSRREERKRKRQERKEASLQARTKWKERRKAHTHTQQLLSSKESAKPNTERKRSLSDVADFSSAKKQRPESTTSPQVESDKKSTDAPELLQQERSENDFSGKKSLSINSKSGMDHSRKKIKTPSNPSNDAENVQELNSKTEDNPDEREIQRLEKLLGIDRLRRQKNARGDSFEYADVFEDGEDDLVGLIEVCDQTLKQRNRLSANGAHHDETHYFGEGESDEAPSEIDDGVSRKVRKIASTKVAASSIPEVSTNVKLDAISKSESESEENQSSFSSSATNQNGEREGDVDDKQQTGSDHGSQYGSQHGACSVYGGEVNVKSSSDHVNRDSRERKQAKTLVKYVPPSMRKRNGATSEGAKRRVRGLLNRVADANASGVAHDISQIFRSKEHQLSRQELSNLYANAALDSVRDGSGVGYVNPYVLSHAAIASHLGKQVDGLILATFLVLTVRRIIVSLEESRDETGAHILVEQDGPGNEVFGYVAVVCALYERKAVSSRVVYDLVRVISDPMTQTRVELLLLLLRKIGALLRKDDSTSLKDMIEFIQSRASDNHAEVSSAKFQIMLDLIEDVKNDKIKKSSSKDKEARFAWATAPDTPFSASIAELLDDEFTSLKWWNQSHELSVAEKNGILSAADGEAMEEGRIEGHEDESRDLATLAHSLRLNTEYRKALFGAIMSSMNVSDSYDKLERMGAFETKNSHDKDTALVILHCCGAEKIFNPFYAHLAEKMCQRSRRCRFTFEFAFCDVFKMLSGSEKGIPMSKRKSRNYFQMLAYLWASKALSLCILRRFPDLQECKEHERMLVQGALDTLFTRHGKENDVLGPFSKLSSENWSGAKAFRLSLAVFIRHHLLQSILKDRKTLVSQALVLLEAE